MRANDLYVTFLAPFAALLPLLATTPAEAAEGTARLTIEVKVKGSETWGNPQDTERGTGKFAHRYFLTTTVKTNGKLSDYNKKDPGYAQQQMNKAARVARAVQTAQGIKPSKPITLEEMQAQLQKEHARCNGDQTCLMGVAMKASQMTTQLYAQQAPETVEDEEEETTPIYLTYFGYENCGSDAHIAIDDSTSGFYADVQGAVPFSSSRKADYKGDDVQKKMLCISHNIVVDTQKKTMWLDGFLLPSAKGTSTNKQGDRSETHTGEMSVNSQVTEWVNEQIRTAALSGTRKVTLPLHRGGGNWVPFTASLKGTAEVQLTWRFEDI